MAPKIDTHFHVPYYDQHRRPLIFKVKKTARLTPRIAHVFGNGQCHSLAIALNEILGWPIYSVYGIAGVNHFIVMTPPRPPTGGIFDADIDGVHCYDWRVRRSSAEAIHRLVKRDDGWLPLAMDFARHHAPVIAEALQRQFNGWKVGHPRPPWELFPKKGGR